MKAEKGHNQHVPTDVYLSFVSSLFDNRFTLFTGMVVHILTFVTVYVQTGAAFYLFLCACFVAVFSYRLYSFFLFDREDKAALTREQIAAWERRYVFGAAERQPFSASAVVTPCWPSKTHLPSWRASPSRWHQWSRWSDAITGRGWRSIFRRLLAVPQWSSEPLGARHLQGPTVVDADPFRVDCPRDGERGA